jgi:6-phosphogluconolactonase
MKKIYPDMNEFCYETAAWFVMEAIKAIAAKGRFVVALSGGSTPRQLFGELAKDKWQKQLDWSKVLIFWGDERFVPVTDAQSNQKMAREALLDHVPIPQKNIFPIPFLATAELSAAQYEADLKQVFAGLPQFDLVFLGLGADGHTASLFPGSAALREKQRWVCSSQPKVSGPARITLTYPVLNHALLICFLVTGREKAEMVRTILNDSPAGEGFPAQRIRPTSGELVWVLDQAAASLMEKV